MVATEPSAVSYTANLPLSWHTEPALDEFALARQRQANLALLRALAGIEAGAKTESEHDADTQFAKAVDRLEAKIDIALSLLARLVSSQSELPPAVPVTLSAQRVEWNGFAVPETGQEITLFIYLSPRLPEPLAARVRVASVAPISGGFHCVAELMERDEEFLEWMTRTVFRHHRRALQTRRQQ